MAWEEDRTVPGAAVSEALSGWLDHVGRLADAHLLHRAALRQAQDQRGSHALGDCQAALGEERAPRESWTDALAHLESVSSPRTGPVRERLGAASRA